MRSTVLEDLIHFLEKEREMYGAFSVSGYDANESPINPTSSSSTQASSPITPTSSPINPKEKKNETKTTQDVDMMNTDQTELNERLNACKSLAELEALCETAAELRTDLEGTRLVFGTGHPEADLMLIGEAPGAQEDKEGVPFVGRGGQLQNTILEAAGLPRSHVYIANILKHRPPDNRDPKPEERERSLPYLLRQIELVNPKIVLCIGLVSATTLLGRKSALKDLRGSFFAFHGRELAVTYHPAALLRNRNFKRPTWEDMKRIRTRYDELGGRPAALKGLPS